MELALSCDIRIAGQNAKLGQPEINLGIIPGGGGTQRLTHLVGEGKSMELILTGDIIDAGIAYDLGLVNHVFPLQELRASTMAIAGRMADKSPVALRLAKESIKNANRMGVREAMDRETDLFCLAFTSEDKKEGVSAFLEKRKADFKGR
jgi:enoyl-CoA hydratase